MSILAAAPASAAELFGGLTAHDIDSPLNKGGQEGGVDVQAGIRGGRIKALKFVGSPQPYAFVSISASGGTNLAAAGLSWKIGGRVFVRPGLGLAIHDRSSNVVYGNLRGDLGSRILFEPELALGIALSERMTAEAVWVHVSNGGIFDRQNPGMDNVGIRLSYRLP